MIDQIQCPNCGFEFDVEEALSGNIQAHFKAEYEKKLQSEISKYNNQKALLEKEKEDFEKKKERENELFNQRLKEKIAQESDKIKKEQYENFSEQLKIQQIELEKKNEENRKLKQQEVALLQKEKDLKNKEEDLRLQLQKEMLQKQNEIEEKVKQKEREEHVLKEKEYQKQLEDQKKLIDEMKRKAEQGSMQLQGEVQELALEELLKNTYPFDIIKEVPKGVRGADCIQEVYNAFQQKCGSIVYESKRTKTFANDWIDKLKQDQLQCKADIAVIVTQTYPPDMTRFGMKNDVWICSFPEVESLSFVLRQMLIKTQSIKSLEENKGDKMEMLYRYFTSEEFVQTVKRIIESQNKMRDQLEAEKRALTKIWSAREKQIWMIQENMSSLFGSISGISGGDLESGNLLDFGDIE